ncbi:hypothetical protein, conserved [Eimeria praecox]|uniref:Uncharacterized protein n=1 Tax=Eimeria praecox TaxID=51316 RepID=U6GZX1_9EIME|nr:hypothetical protein, conserved [Eimeria praecox]
MISLVVIIHKLQASEYYGSLEEALEKLSGVLEEWGEPPEETHEGLSLLRFPHDVLKGVITHALGDSGAGERYRPCFISHACLNQPLGPLMFDLIFPLKLRECDNKEYPSVFTNTAGL